MLEISKDGIKIDSLDDIKERLENAFKSVYGQDVNLSSDTPDGQLIGIFSQELANIHSAVTFIVDMLDPYKAYGKWLEQRALYSGIVRNTASYSYIDDVVLLGMPKTNIPNGTRFTDANNNKWEITEPTKLNDLGSARVKLRSVELGNYDVKENESLTSDTVIIGIDTITTLSASYGGADVETDDQLRKRLLQSHVINNLDDRKGIEAKLLQVAGVKQARVYENSGNITNGDGVPAHSINAVIIGGDDKDIAEVITKNKIGGCGLFGQIETSYYYKGDNRLVRFDRASKVPISVIIEIERINNFNSINTDEIIKNLKDINFNIGQNVYTTRLISSVNLTDGFYVRSIKANNQDVVNIGIREYAEIDNVEVLIV